jgi:16S rRNA (adenine1518-N6/adenine1519-N6)-dimethyltransferase
MCLLAGTGPTHNMLPRAKKSYGQNFLIDASVVEKIVVAAEITKGETVLEIGPGTGVLTEALVRAGAHVIAVELDHDMIQPLKDKFGDKIELIEGDVLKKGVINSRPDPFKIVANIPYNITSAIIEKFLAHEPRPTRMILMVQKEVADRLLAKPPEMSLLSVVCQLYADVSRVAHVKAGSFRPIPKVDSAVVKFEVFPPPLQGGGEGVVVGPERVIALAKAGFSSPRKQVHHNLLPYVRRLKPAATTEDVKSLLISIGLDEKVRAENLKVEDWERIGRELWSCGAS